ncbi:hypothetical protein HRbin15_00055 [bacterium HR15]|nr:hypothetical protein HRbin15_00055 [bacterium HR15]
MRNIRACLMHWLCCGMAWVLLSPALWAVPLPQNHPYQVTLRNYMASLTESDFELPLNPLSYDANYFQSEDNLYRTWLITGFYSTPRLEGLRYPASQFTLQTIEGNANRVLIPHVWPHEIAWWAQWNYPGNPYYGNRAIKLRAFVSAAVDMIMLDDAHERGLYRRSDFLGGTLIWLAYAYGVAKDVLPAEVQAAYEVGLRKFFERIEQWGPTGAFGDMDSMALVSMYYTAQAIGDPDLAGRAYIYAGRVINLHFQNGIERHQGGYDASYNGIAIFFLTWAALLTDWDIVVDVVDRLHEVKSHLTLPEPGNTFYGPSHFSSNTSADVANDQWSGSPPRDIGAAMVTDKALYLAFGGRSGRTWAWAVPTVAAMTQAVQRWINGINAALTPLSASPSVWGERHWIRSESSTYAGDYYRPGTYARLQQLLQSQSPLILPLFTRSQIFINHLFDRKVFLSIRFPFYGAIFYTGELSPQVSPIAGFGGGNLSAFWTPSTGSVILGRRRGFQGSNIDRWEEWRTWPVNAMSGAVPDGRAFTTAGYRPSTNDRDYWVQPDMATVELRGRIGDAYTSQNGAIRGQIIFRRRFTADPRGVTVDAILLSDGVDIVSELYEAIPLFLYDSVRQRNVPHRVWFLINEEWTQITTEDLYTDVQQVKVERFNGAVRIVFETPQWVKLGTQWVDGFQSGATCRNLLLDLLRNNGQPVNLPAEARAWYRIVPVLPGDVDGNGCVDDADLLMVLLAFGRSGYLLADANGDGQVDDADLLLVLNNFGTGC